MAALPIQEKQIKAPPATSNKSAYYDRRRTTRKASSISLHVEELETPCQIARGEPLNGISDTMVVLSIVVENPRVLRWLSWEHAIQPKGHNAPVPDQESPLRTLAFGNNGRQRKDAIEWFRTFVEIRTRGEPPKRNHLLIPLSFLHPSGAGVKHLQVFRDPDTKPIFKPVDLGWSCSRNKLHALIAPTLQ